MHRCLSFERRRKGSGCTYGLRCNPTTDSEALDDWHEKRVPRLAVVGAAVKAGPEGVTATLLRRSALLRLACRHLLRAGLADFGEAGRRDTIVTLPVAVNKIVAVLGLEGGAGRAGHRAAELVVELRRGETVEVNAVGCHEILEHPPAAARIPQRHGVGVERKHRKGGGHVARQRRRERRAELRGRVLSADHHEHGAPALVHSRQRRRLLLQVDTRKHGAGG